MYLQSGPLNIPVPPGATHSYPNVIDSVPSALLHIPGTVRDHQFVLPDPFTFFSQSPNAPRPTAANLLSVSVSLCQFPLLACL